MSYLCNSIITAHFSVLWMTIKSSKILQNQVRYHLWICFCASPFGMLIHCIFYNGLLKVLEIYWGALLAYIWISTHCIESWLVNPVIYIHFNRQEEISRSRWSNALTAIFHFLIPMLLRPGMSLVKETIQLLHRERQWGTLNYNWRSIETLRM